jgi:mono/diheme cytochrome c family protein
MKQLRIHFAVAAILIFAAGIFFAAAQPSATITAAPVYVPDVSHQNDPLPDGVIDWDATLKAVDAFEGQDFAKFTFSFTNVAKVFDVGMVTNVITLTNFTTVTNSSFWARLWGKSITRVASISYDTNAVAVTNVTPVPITILDVHPGCGCTTAELPPRPWTLPPGTSGEMKFSVNLAGKSGMLFKTVTVTADKGKKDLMLRINLLPPPVVTMTEDQKAAGIAAAKVDRQAVFKGDCATCHLKNVEGRNGAELFKNACAICHEAEHRASMVTDLNKLTVPTSEDFWRTWITYGKPGSLMPAFASSQGGPLNDLQIASLAQYLNAVHPSAATNAPAK